MSREQLAQHIQTYLANGGQITRVPYGQKTPDSVLREMKRRKEEAKIERLAV